MTMSTTETITEERREKFIRWLKYIMEDSNNGSIGTHGPTPQGEPQDYWRGHRNAFAEISAFVERPELMDNWP